MPVERKREKAGRPLSPCSPPRPPIFYGVIQLGGNFSFPAKALLGWVPTFYNRNAKYRRWRNVTSSRKWLHVLLWRWQLAYGQKAQIPEH